MADVVLKNKSGTPVTYAGVKAVQLKTPDGGMQLFSEGGGSPGGDTGGAYVSIGSLCFAIDEVYAAAIS